jgi:hypothetical protein
VYALDAPAGNPPRSAVACTTPRQSPASPARTAFLDFTGPFFALGADDQPTKLQLEPKGIVTGLRPLLDGEVVLLTQKSGAFRLIAGDPRRSAMRCDECGRRRQSGHVVGKEALDRFPSGDRRGRMPAPPVARRNVRDEAMAAGRRYIGVAFVAGLTDDPGELTLLKHPSLIRSFDEHNAHVLHALGVNSAQATSRSTARLVSPMTKKTPRRSTADSPTGDPNVG